MTWALHRSRTHDSRSDLTSAYRDINSRARIEPIRPHKSSLADVPLYANCTLQFLRSCAAVNHTSHAGRMGSGNGDLKTASDAALCVPLSHPATQLACSVAPMCASCQPRAVHRRHPPSITLPGQTPTWPWRRTPGSPQASITRRKE